MLTDVIGVQATKDLPLPGEVAGEERKRSPEEQEKINKVLAEFDAKMAKVREERQSAWDENLAKIEAQAAEIWAKKVAAEDARRQAYDNAARHGSTVLNAASLF